MKKVTRVEIIDHTKTLEDWWGRVFSRWDLEEVELHVQDKGKTLKIFLNK